MIILDTDILSELMRATPNKTVLTWLDRQTTSNLFTTTITLAEIAYGLGVLPSGKRKKALETAFHHVVLEAFDNRVLSFTQEAAFMYGSLMAYRKNSGQPLSICDGQIAAIAKSQGFIVATRNIQDFKGCGIDLINPFSKQSAYMTT